MNQLIFCNAIVLGTVTLAAIGGGDFELSRATIDGGGVMLSTGGPFILSGTIGQFDAGQMFGGDFQMSGGFWFETPPGDCNENGAVGFMDFDEFFNCLTGPAGDVPAGCDCFDVDGSNTVDIFDFSEIQFGFLGE